MSNVLDLDALREDVEKDFSSVTLNVGGEEVVLRNTLRIPRAARTKVKELMAEVAKLAESMEEEGSDQMEIIEKQAELTLQILPIIADKVALGNKLVASLKDDLAMTLRVFTVWTEATQAGEAPASES